MLKSEVFDPKLEGSLVYALIGNTLELSCFQQAEMNANTQLFLSRLIMCFHSHLKSFTSALILIAAADAYFTSHWIDHGKTMSDAAKDEDFINDWRSSCKAHAAVEPTLRL
ncbi:hypothetical protein N7G274_000606 [Stereocaulon virgatum]|uniref:Uncharacterized protein n=1 Tax=Stereocaulon virgatum TaxID=373712 RepID=A0ABR4AVM7_9LECA